MKSLTMWAHGARACTFVYGGYAQPVLRLVENDVLLREEIIAPGTAVTLSEMWDVETRSRGNDAERGACAGLTVTGRLEE